MSSPRRPTRWHGGPSMSPGAKRRWARSIDPVPVPVPDLADGAAVAQWRGDIHRLWGEEVDSGEPEHRAGRIGMVPVVRAGRPTATARIVYVHGGGFCLGSPGVAIPITARLAAAAQVISIGYRLAPEHPHPAAVVDVRAVCQAIGLQGRYVLAGDSAGAWIAAQVAASRPRGVVGLALLSPLIAPNEPTAATDELLMAYRAGADLPSIARTPASIDVPTMLQVGEREDVTAVERCADALASRGTPVELHAWRHMWHTWHYHRGVAEADEALALVGEWAGARCDGSAS